MKKLTQEQFKSIVTEVVEEFAQILEKEKSIEIDLQSEIQACIDNANQDEFELSEKELKKLYKEHLESVRDEFIEIYK